MVLIVKTRAVFRVIPLWLFETEDKAIDAPNNHYPIYPKDNAKVRKFSDLCNSSPASAESQFRF